MKEYKKRSGIILASVIGLLLLSMVFLFGLFGRITDKMDQGSNERMLDTTRIIQSSIRRQFRNDEERLNSFAGLYALRGGSNRSTGILASYAKATDFSRFYYIDLSGAGIDSNGKAVDAASLPFEETALAKGEYGYSDVYIGSSGRLEITFQSPVLLDGVQIGALYADKTMASYRDPSLFTFTNGTGYAFIVDGDGSWIIESTGSEKDDIYAFLDENGNSPQVRETLKNLMKDRAAGTMEITFHGEKSILCFLPKGNPYNWYLLSIMPKSVLQQESGEILHMVIMTCGELAFALLLITVLLLGRESMKGRERGRMHRERLFQNISSNIDFAFLLYTPEKRTVEMVSDNVQALYDVAPEQVASRPDILFLQCGVPRGDKDMAAFFEGRLKDKVQREYRTGMDDELQRWTEVHYLPAGNGQYLAVLHDTTREHHMRDDLADALLQSQENNRARTAFFSSMSHDIRTPMNGIIGMTAIARANLGNRSKTEDCLDKISLASEHLLALINEVLDMSRIESGKLSLKNEPVNLPELISNVLLLIKPELTKRGHTLRVKSAVLDYDTVIGDALHIQKILMNLLTNAIKYTPEGGEISIGLQEQKREDEKIDIVFQVEDNGIGMEPDFVKRIFCPFERAEDSRLNKITGSGLGMAITKNIVDIMGGTIQVESTPGAGSKFTVVLPMKVGKADIPAAESLSGHRVLVVDDSADVCEGIRIMLEESGLHVDRCLSGSGAVEAAVRAHQEGDGYFAVIVDWKMPQMDGVETARRLRADLGEDIPILLLSAYNWEDVEQEALDAGINGFLTKPIFRSELMQKLRFYILGSSVKIQEAPHSVPQYQFHGLRVLLAEDNDLNREIAEELLREAGIQVDSVENGLLAVRRIEQNEAGRYDMVLMDIHMPVMDGLEAVGKIRQLPDQRKARIPVIAMTADAFEEDIRICEQAGMDGHISKPINIETMFEVIRSFDTRKMEERE